MKENKSRKEWEEDLEDFFSDILAETENFKQRAEFSNCPFLDAMSFADRIAHLTKSIPEDVIEFLEETYEELDETKRNLEVVQGELDEAINEIKDVAFSLDDLVLRTPDAHLREKLEEAIRFMRSEDYERIKYV